MMKTKYILFILSFLLFVQLYGQTFEEYKKQQESEFAVYKQKQQAFINQMQNEFDAYVKQQDQEFAKYLEEQWKSFTVFKGEKPPDMPKPPVKPTYATEEAEKESAIIKHLRRPAKDLEEVKSSPDLLPMIKKSAVKKTNGSAINISFYGNALSFDVDNEIIIPPPSEINAANISKYWLSFSESDFGHLMDQLQNYRDIMNLNDWAYYLLTKAFADKVYLESEIGAELMHWSLLTRSGYKARIGYTANEVTVLIPTNNTLYSKLYLQSGGLTFYMMKELSSDNIRTYDKDYPEANGILDFNIERPLNFVENLKHRKFDFNYQGKAYTFNIDYNKNIIDFYRDYPQVNLEVYFNAAVSTSSKESIIRSMSESISGMTEEQAVGFLLEFVQTAFSYEIDQKQFGKEKFFFAEETVFYPASDCEDRSVLFAYLVQELLNTKVIGLNYPGHVATAVKMTQKAEGDCIVFDNEEYIMADATYENAPLGLTMPAYRNKEPELIVLNNYNYYQSINQSYWELANQAGGYRGDQLNDLFTDEKGNTYLTGYFINNAEFGDYALKSEQSGRSVFVAKYNKYQKVDWAKQITSSQNATGYALTMDKNGDLFAAGSFNGSLDFGSEGFDLSCKENATDVFVAKMSENGQLIWIKKAGLDTYPQENYFSYNVRFTKDGTGKGTTLYSENEYATNFGLSIDQYDILNINGSFMNSTGFGLNMLSMRTDEGSEFRVYESLKLENDKLIENDYEQTIAGVFSVLNHVKLKGFKMLGSDAQKTLDEYNPDFKEKYPDIYEGISEINFVMNDDGILSLETLNGKTVVLRELKLKNNAKLKVTHYEDGNATVNVLSGMQVGKFFIWFDLNYAKMFKKDGNILFDYDSKHAQKLMNLKEDILD